MLTEKRWQVTYVTERQSSPISPLFLFVVRSYRNSCSSDKYNYTLEIFYRATETPTPTPTPPPATFPTRPPPQAATLWGFPRIKRTPDFLADTHTRYERWINWPQHGIRVSISVICSVAGGTITQLAFLLVPEFGHLGQPFVRGHRRLT